MRPNKGKARRKMARLSPASSPAIIDSWGLLSPPVQTGERNGGGALRHREDLPPSFGLVSEELIIQKTLCFERAEERLGLALP